MEQPQQQPTLRAAVKAALEQPPASFVFDAADVSRAISDGKGTVAQLTSDHRVAMVITITRNEAQMRRGTALLIVALLAAGFGQDAPHWLTVLLVAAQQDTADRIAEPGVQRNGRTFNVLIDKENGLITLVIEEPVPQRPVGREKVRMAPAAPGAA